MVILEGQTKGTADHVKGQDALCGSWQVDADVGLRVGLNISGKHTVNMWKVGCMKDAFEPWATRVLALGYRCDVE